MTSERQAYVYVQLPGTLDTVPAALLKVEKLRDGTFVGRFRYGDRYLERKQAIAFDPFKLPLGNTVQEFTKLKGIPGAVRDASPGTSMGGARPKATIEDGNRLWIGKFPEKADRCNLQRIEYASIELARRCGIAACNARLESVGGRDVLMIERFDRQNTEGGYLRFGLVSGLTLLDCDENYLDRERWSYPLLADELRRWSEKPDEDRVELFRRIVFNAAVTNNDDHPPQPRSAPYGARLAPDARVRPRAGTRGKP